MCIICRKEYNENTTEIWCSHTLVTEIPLLPELKELHCSNTRITEIPILKDCKINYNSCEWLNPPKERIPRVTTLQNKISTVNQQRHKCII